MSDLTIKGVQGNRDFGLEKPERTGEAAGFGDVMQDALAKLSQVQREADEAVKGFASGGDMTQALLAMQKVEMSFQFMVEVRNRLLSAYEEISRMQV
jgi:flagellar hook-basal body complex protein FliE